MWWLEKPCSFGLPRQTLLMSNCAKWIPKVGPRQVWRDGGSCGGAALQHLMGGDQVMVRGATAGRR